MSKEEAPSPAVLVNAKIEMDVRFGYENGGRRDYECAGDVFFGTRSNANAPISVKPFNAYQVELKGVYDKPISANTFPAMAQEKNTNKSSVLNLNNGNDNIININMQFFAEKDLKTQKSESLKRGIRKLESKIELHKSELNNPQEYDRGWDMKPEKEKAGLKKHWQKETDNFEKSIENRIEELKKEGIIMTDSAFQFIIERIINNALDSVKEAKDNPGEEFYLGRKMAHYEILDIIKNELEIRDEELGEFGLDFNLEEVFL